MQVKVQPGSIEPAELMRPRLGEQTSPMRRPMFFTALDLNTREYSIAVDGSVL